MAESNLPLARIFRFLANAMEWQRENAFKVRAYRQAAETFERLSEPVEELIRTNTLQDQPHIGEAIDKKAREYSDSGSFPALARVQAAIPGGVQELLKLPGMTGRAAKALEQKLQVLDVASLRGAKTSGAVDSVKWTPAVREAVEKALNHLEKLQEL